MPSAEIRKRDKESKKEPPAELKQTAKKVTALLEQTLMAPDTPGEITFPVNTEQRGVLLNVLISLPGKKGERYEEK